MNKVRKYFNKYELETMLRFVLKYKKAIANILLLSTMNMIFMYLPPIVNIYIIDKGIGEGKIGIIVSFTILLYVIYIVIEWVTILLNRKKSQLVYKMKKKLENKILIYCMQTADIMDRGEIDSLIKTDCEIYVRFVSTMVENILTSIAGVVCVSAILFSVHKVMTIIVIILQVMLICFQLWANGILERNSVKIREKFIKVMNVTNEIIENINKLIPIGALIYAKKKFNNALDEEFRIEYDQTIYERKIMSVISLFSSLITCLTIVIGGYFVINKQMTVGKLLSFSQYSTMFLTPIIELMGLPVEFSNNYSRIKSISKILKKSTLDAEKNLLNLECKKLKSVSVRDLNFGYGKKEILKHIHMDFKVGVPNYITGESGVGKSTLVKLLMRQFDSYQGHILYNDKSIRELDVNMISSCVAYASQDSVIFNDTIVNNIVLDAQVDYNRLEKICIECQIWDTIIAMEDGLYTKISDRGDNLSGGQKQKLCLARALYADKPIIILDEITSGLDDEAEKKIKYALKKYFTQKIFIIVSHSKNFILQESNIFKLDKIIS